MEGVVAIFVIAGFGFIAAVLRLRCLRLSSVLRRDLGFCRTIQGSAVGRCR
jgi:hypothetical protein